MCLTHQHQLSRRRFAALSSDPRSFFSFLAFLAFLAFFSFLAFLTFSPDCASLSRAGADAAVTAVAAAAPPSAAPPTTVAASRADRVGTPRWAPGPRGARRTWVAAHGEEAHAQPRLGDHLLELVVAGECGHLLRRSRQLYHNQAPRDGLGWARGRQERPGRAAGWAARHAASSAHARAPGTSSWLSPPAWSTATCSDAARASATRISNRRPSCSSRATTGSSPRCLSFTPLSHALENCHKRRIRTALLHSGQRAGRGGTHARPTAPESSTPPPLSGPAAPRKTGHVAG